jgi:hypothetical protein
METLGICGGINLCITSFHGFGHDGRYKGAQDL